MRLIVCLDDKNGISFGERRQSRVRVQVERMLKTVGEEKLYISDYSAPLFGEIPSNVFVCSSPVEEAGDNYCFIEAEGVFDGDFEEIIIYRWNRGYPSDEKFNCDLLRDKKLVSSTDFKGNSHEKITEEIYR